MRSPVRPDEIDSASILLYDVSGTAELLARATIWPFYGIKAAAWSTEANGSAAITIVDGIAALEPVEAGFSEDLVRAWFILTDQPVVTHLLAVPANAPEDDVAQVRVSCCRRRSLPVTPTGGTCARPCWRKAAPRASSLSTFWAGSESSWMTSVAPRPIPSSPGALAELAIP